MIGSLVEISRRNTSSNGFSERFLNEFCLLINTTKATKTITLQGTNISHLGNRKIIDSKYEYL